MREIKFRSWYDDKMQVNPTFTFYNHGAKGDAIMLVDGWENRVIMQYTGLKDKNGVEIYEGDIVNNNASNWEIYHKEAHYCMATEGKRTENDHLFIREARHSLVIGNIYQNPELLK